MGGGGGGGEREAFHQANNKTSDCKSVWRTLEKFMRSLFKLSEIVIHLFFGGLRDTCKQLLDQSVEEFSPYKNYTILQIKPANCAF